MLLGACIATSVSFCLYLCLPALSRIGDQYSSAQRVVSHHCSCHHCLGLSSFKCSCHQYANQIQYSAFCHISTILLSFGSISVCHSLHRLKYNYVFHIIHLFIYLLNAYKVLCLSLWMQRLRGSDSRNGPSACISPYQISL